jgi:hypothetical protein
MISVREVEYGLYGAYRLAHLDPQGMTYFDTSPRGYWRSFFAAVITAPAYAIIVILGTMDAVEAGHELTGGWLHLALLEGVGYVIEWFAFPLIMLHLCDGLGKRREYRGFIVAYNWAAVLQSALFLPVAAAASAGMLPGAIGMVVALATLALILLYQGYIARTALGIGTLPAVGIVAIGLVLAFVVSDVVQALW